MLCVPTLQAQTLHPLSDIGAVRHIIEQLGDELGKRMTAAGATPGSRQVGSLLAAMHPHASSVCHVCRGGAAVGREFVGASCDGAL